MRCRDISPDTAKKLNDDIFDGHANLYYHFIKKSVQHLNHGGELIFVTPRDFIRATGAAGLNEWLYAQGAFTHFKDYAMKEFLVNFLLTVRYGGLSKGGVPERWMTVAFSLRQRLLYFGGGDGNRLGDYFDVKVGAVSGADDRFYAQKRQQSVCLLAHAADGAMPKNDIQRKPTGAKASSQAFIGAKNTKI